MRPRDRAKVCCRLFALASSLVLLLALVGQSRAQTLPVSFVARIDTPLPGVPIRPFPACVAAADFNSDGKLDVVTCGNANNIWVLLGNGDGTFQPAATYTAGTIHPDAVVLGDFNGDGKTDILVVNNDSTVLLNNGDGTFQTQVVTSPTTNAPGAVAVGDFNGDGKADIAVPVVVPQHGDSAVAILLGNGDGTFQSPIQSNGYAPTPSAIQVADFDEDGKLDISWENYSGGIEVFLGNGNGTVQPPLSTDTEVGVFYLTVADFNNDGIPDLAISSYESIDVFLGKGDGTFGTGTEMLTPVSCGALLVGDFNGDGIPDLGCYRGGVNEFSILLGKGDGTFQQLLEYNIPGDAIAAGDFNGDGRLDL